MQQNNNPLSPHLQIYKWQISSLLSITHRIVGVINILAITLICIWTLSLLAGENTYEITHLFLKSLFGKFVIVFLCWTFSFHILKTDYNLNSFPSFIRFLKLFGSHTNGYN